jgi:hypothetical protein
VRRERAVVLPLAIDECAVVCGHFNLHPASNNGFRWLHLEQEEVDEGEGHCYAGSYPLARGPDPDDTGDRALKRALPHDPYGCENADG